LLILGDITHVLSKLERTLKLFKSKFKDVYYCPGNHELWTQSVVEDDNLQIDNSIEKFYYVKNDERIIIVFMSFVFIRY
jgi:hypothetical protein